VTKEAKTRPLSLAYGPKETGTQENAFTRQPVLTGRLAEGARPVRPCLRTLPKRVRAYPKVPLSLPASSLRESTSRFDGASGCAGAVRKRFAPATGSAQMQ